MPLNSLPSVAGHSQARAVHGGCYVVKMRHLWKSLIGSLLLSTVLTVSAYGVGSVGLDKTARLLVWPGMMLQELVPGVNIGTDSHPVYEATPIHIIAFFLGVVAQIPIYWIVLYGTIRWRRKVNT